MHGAAHHPLVHRRSGCDQLECRCRIEHAEACRSMQERLAQTLRPADVLGIAARPRRRSSRATSSRRARQSGPWRLKRSTVSGSRRRVTASLASALGGRPRLRRMLSARSGKTSAKGLRLGEFLVGGFVVVGILGDHALDLGFFLIGYRRDFLLHRPAFPSGSPDASRRSKSPRRPDGRRSPRRSFRRRRRSRGTARDGRERSSPFEELGAERRKVQPAGGKGLAALRFVPEDPHLFPYTKNPRAATAGASSPCLRGSCPEVDVLLVGVAVDLGELRRR